MLNTLVKSVVLFLLLPPISALAEMTPGTYRDGIDQLSYLVFKPETAPERPGLIVVLHGCFQTAQQMADGTAFNTLAAERGFAVLYPDQSYVNNPWKCWNWFRAENLTRTGELALLAGMTRQIIDDLDVDPDRVFVAGLSAGGGMAANLAACYAEIYGGFADHSGIEYKAAASEQEAHAVLKNGSSRNLHDTASDAVACSRRRISPTKVMVLHGTEDPNVGPVNSERIIAQARIISDLHDDGEANDSIVYSESADAVPAPTPSGYPARTREYRIRETGQPVLKEVWVEGMGHAWSGGNPVAPYMDPRGPSAAILIADFLGL